MSAIAGICAFDDQADLPELGRRMMSSLAQYPADSAQSWHRGGVFLGCRAQWITPESVGEQLPYYDERRGIAITADAILDNRDELFERLQIHPSLRRTMTDSALILLAYEKWGEDAPKHLIGDFAFVIWDERQRRLFGARDFSGARTLYYYHQPRKLAFCTVLEPLLALPDADKSLNEQWIAEFLALMGTTDAIDPRMTVYREIRQLPPSHSMTVAEGKITLRKYCTVEAGETLRLKSDRDYEEAFKDVFGKAVRARLRSRWKVGAQLSGGMDSGTVAGFAARMLQEEGSRLHTFSYVPVDGFEDWTPKRRFANERPYIESSAKHIGNIETHIHSFPEKNPFTEMDDGWTLWKCLINFLKIRIGRKESTRKPIKCKWAFC
jgi:asparagine synthase (glutamine-hydrolysing)